MASDQTEMLQPQPSFVERLINSRNMVLSVFLPIILGLTNNPSSTNPDQDSSERGDPRDRIILINPLTQGMVVIEGSSSGMDSLLRDLLSKYGQPPASKASIEAMPSVEAKEGDECVICLEELRGFGDLAKEMPCKHSFHGECIEKWLKIHGSYPVCRYKMPVDDDQDVNNKSVFGSEERGGRRREIWVSFSFSNTDRRSGDTNQTAYHDSPGPDNEM